MLRIRWLTDVGQGGGGGACDIGTQLQYGQNLICYKAKPGPLEGLTLPVPQILDCSMVSHFCTEPDGGGACGGVAKAGGGSAPTGDCQLTFLVRALGRVPKWGSAARSTGLLISEGTDSVLRSLATVWKGGNPLGTDARGWTLAPGCGKGPLTWEEGYSAGGSFLCALIMTL